MKKVKFLVATLLMVLVLCVPTCTQAAITGTAKTQSQLEKILIDESIGVIKISTSKKITFTIPKGKSITVFLLNMTGVS